MRISTYAFLAPAALLLASAPAALMAQEVVQPLPGTTDGDRLAEQMRALAANPRDIDALIAAANLSLTLGDLSGAASLYARAEKVSASDPRIKAGEGAILVRSERPGEALRYFAQAEAAGADMRGFAADRGLAYDLIGQQERAQRDYRVALKTSSDDEIVKRYALSLGISGKREAALEQLDPLLRKTDRSAWRIRAFILAMGGDQAGADKIAVTMLPPGMAQGLQPFFRRLPTLPAADRAFAVHFGEVHSTPERIADARYAPVLPQLAAEPAPVALAAVQPAALPGKKDKRRREATVLAATVARPVQPQAVTQTYQGATAALARVQPVPQQPVTLASTATAAPLSVATTPPPVARPPVSLATTVRPVTQPVPTVTKTFVRPATVTPTLVTQTPVASAPVTSAPVQLASVAPIVRAAPVPTAATPAATVTTTVAPPPVTVTTAAATPAPGFTTSAIQPATPAPAPPTATVETAATVQTPPAATPTAPNFAAPPSRMEADSVLARIVAGLSIPAAELGVIEPVRVAPVAAVPPPDTTARVIAEAKAKEARDAAAEKALALKTAADKRATAAKAATDRKALAAKKVADEKKLADAKAAAEERKAAAEEKRIARANPSRIWVQIASGANEGDLARAYATIRAKAPATFGARAAWSTPLRATNRVLTGPFRTDAEARTFVNQLSKEGVPAYAFTSEAGQVVAKLAAKSAPK